METQSIPSIRLTAADPNRAVSSRLGGDPSLGDLREWPKWNGRPLGFVAQIELSELPATDGLEWLPRVGRLLFFYDAQQEAWGFDPEDKGAWRVIYDSGEQPSALASPPDDVPAEARFPQTPVQGSIALSKPDLWRLKHDKRHLTEAQFDELSDLATPTSPAHQIGGYPSAVQGDDMELECQLASNGIYVGDSSGYESQQASTLKQGASDWLLLLQVDSDDEAGMMWGDCGMLYFWIRRQDAVAADFSKVWMVLQCY